MGLTSVLSSSLVNDFRFSYSYFRNRLAPPSQAQCEQISGDPTFCFGLNGPLISFFGGLQVGTNVNVSQDRHPRTFQFTDNVNWTKGSHRIRFGGNWEHSNNHGTWNRNATGIVLGLQPDAGFGRRNPALFAALPASLKTGFTGPRATFAELLQLPMNAHAEHRHRRPVTAGSLPVQRSPGQRPSSASTFRMAGRFVRDSHSIMDWAGRSRLTSSTTTLICPST